MIFIKNYYVNVSEKVDVLLVTHDVKRAVGESGIASGLVTVLVPGATAGVIILEHDPKIFEDYKQWVEKQIPVPAEIRPSRRSGSGRNAAHVRAALVGLQISIPLDAGKLQLGPWQEVVLYDFDDKIGRRELTIQIMGDGPKK